MDLGGAPKRVLQAHSSDQIADLFVDPRSAPVGTGLPSPVGGDARSMPTHDRVGPENGYGVKDARAATIEPDENGSVGPTQMHSTWHALLQDVELMPQYLCRPGRPGGQALHRLQNADPPQG